MPCNRALGMQQNAVALARPLNRKVLARLAGCPWNLGNEVVAQPEPLRGRASPLTIVWVAQEAVMGATRAIISLSSIQSVRNSGWLGTMNAAVPSATPASNLACSLRGKSISGTFISPRTPGTSPKSGNDLRPGMPPSISQRLTGAMALIIRRDGLGARKVVRRDVFAGPLADWVICVSAGTVTLYRSVCPKARSGIFIGVPCSIGNRA